MLRWCDLEEETNGDDVGCRKNARHGFILTRVQIYLHVYGNLIEERRSEQTSTGTG
jgi:hypothetical protein